MAPKTLRLFERQERSCGPVIDTRSLGCPEEARSIGETKGRSRSQYPAAGAVDPSSLRVGPSGIPARFVTSQGRQRNGQFGRGYREELETAFERRGSNDGLVRQIVASVWNPACVPPFRTGWMPRANTDEYGFVHARSDVRSQYHWGGHRSGP